MSTRAPHIFKYDGPLVSLRHGSGCLINLDEIESAIEATRIEAREHIAA